MNKEQRKIYLILTTIDYPDNSSVILCNFCKYARWEGICSEAEVECKHPIERVSDWEYDKAIEGFDCWGFTANISPEDAVDMCGIWLQGKAVDHVSTDYRPQTIHKPKKPFKQLALIK